ncbi:MAG: LCP family protein [Peptococcaceae bacterium]|nr:LCP family protein [Peptococcaceae bacterium]
MEEQHFPSRSDRHKNEKIKKEKPKKEKPAKADKSGIFISRQKDDLETTIGRDKAGRVIGDAWYMKAEEIEAEELVKPKKKRKKRNPILTVLLLLVLLAGGLWCGYTVTGLVLPDPHAGLSDQQKEMLNNVNILVLGCDEREGESQARADVIIVATIRPDDKEVSLFSIPRDTRVSIEGHGKDKINHAMAFGGIPLITDSVELLLGIQIDHAVKVNFDGFINVIDALGGVNINVPEKMYKPLEAIDLLPGYQTLYGEDALAFVRWRGDGLGDYGRIARQQQFIAALTEKVKNMSVGQALDVLDAVMDSIETDMSVREMTSYATNLIGLSSDKVHTYSFVGGSVYINGVNYVEPDMEEIKAIVDKMQHGEQPAEEHSEENTEAVQ